MSEDQERLETLFSGALRCSSLERRRQYLDEVCGEDAGLRRQVESLLRAHDAAENFLDSETVELTHHSVSTDLPGQHLYLKNYSAEFLRLSNAGEEPDLKAYLEQLPPDVREETRERIHTALAAQTLLEESPAAAETPAEGLPFISGFKIEKTLGRGGLGVVYEAFDEKLQRRVALKVLRRAPDEQARRRILDEARKAAAFHDPAIVTIHSILDECDPPAIVMEHVEGFPIDKYSNGVTFSQKARLLQEIARALAVAHSRGLIHRDLKPENVLVTPDMKPKILDFGLAVSLEEGRHRKRFFEGSPYYASPEQVGGRPITPASDVFSFGSLMFKVLTGKPPFPGSRIREVLDAIATTNPPFLRDVAVGVPEELQAICLACLTWKPEDRPSAEDLATDLGRYLAGEPIRLRPALYGDILRRRITDYSRELVNWERQGMVSSDEKDRLQIVHRRILADEDHWIIDARHLTLAQTLLYTSTWVVVVAAVFLVWLVRDELSPPLKWLAPSIGTVCLLAVGFLAEWRKEPLASASFLAGAVLSLVPTILSLLAEFNVLATAPEDITQLFDGAFTNQQVLASCLIALLLSLTALYRLRMTGFAWTTAALATASYLGVLLLYDLLVKDPEIMALWCLPLISFELIALLFERTGRVRWAMPFHLVALVALIGALDVIAANGPTLGMLGLDEQRWAYLDPDRQMYFSYALNGCLFLIFMIVTERSRSLDLRRASKILEIAALIHVLGALYANAQTHRDAEQVLLDVSIYLGAVIVFLALGPWRSRWRLLVGGLSGVALGCYLLIDLDLVPAKTFVLGMGTLGLIVAAATYLYLLSAPRPKP